MTNVIQAIPLIWEYRGYKMELSSSRLRWKIYNKEKQVISNGYSLNGKKLDKKDIETKLIEALHIRDYQPIIS